MFRRRRIILIFLILLIVIAVLGIIFLKPLKMSKVSYTQVQWIQTNWRDGADLVNFPEHPYDKDRNWKKYHQKDEEIATPGDEIDGDLVLASTTSFRIQSTDNEFKDGKFSLTTVSGTRAEADIILACKGLDGTCYRKPIVIFSPISTLTNYQVLVTLDTASLIGAKKLQPNCEDLRFSDSNGTASLNYWLESGCNTTATKIWVKVPFLPVGHNSIYLYYGNPLANSISNGKETFLAFNWKFDGPIGGRSSFPSDHTCALLSNGNVRCWGWNNYGQLGDGTLTDRTTPISISDLTDAISIAPGRFHTCVLLSSSRGNMVKCWGDNRFGQLGVPATKSPILLPHLSGLTNVVAIAAGEFHTCALLSDGKVTCVGNNADGQLGDGTNINKSRPSLILDLNNAVEIAAGAVHTCALLSDGSVKCWGNNQYGQLGDGTKTHRNKPVLVSDLTNAVAISAGWAHTCALLSNGRVKCWGWNYDGQLGDGTHIDSNIPISALDLNNAVAIMTGGWHSCALLSDSTVKCWGANSFGQLGDGSMIDRVKPVLVSDLTNVTSIAGGGYTHSCALLSDGSVKCWGLNTHGQLGNGTTAASISPVPVLRFNLGGRYDKSRGITSIPEPSKDIYFVRQFTHPEPTVSVGKEEISYSSSGNFISSPKDFGSFIKFTTLSWIASTPSYTNIKFQISTSPDNLTWTDFLGPDGANSTYYTIPGTSIWTGHNSHRYLKYKVYLETTDTSQTPRLHELKVGYNHYSSSGSLISSPYNTMDPKSILGKIRWAESTTSGVTDVKFQLRTAPDLAGKPGNWTSWMGPDGTNNSYFTDPTGRETLPSVFSDGVNDQWIQYKALLTTINGSQTPFLFEVALEYGIPSQ